ncbi:cell division protein ZapE [Aliidiomarina taiwanensis]|uniref:Cell division protein ZapE n=1 Tax=Aliidiomarina taiwanensis TaxID=946228 RepID=A0A432X1Q8_9GAMM|nr:cell division protein ZapE [Aliidiomarina taiwanensis]RUO40452.1 cell division protein ZapE [Aliidiomarina taiwanensis]
MTSSVLPSTEKLSPLEAYQQALASGFKPDAAQAAAVKSLQACYKALHSGHEQVQGVYLYGPVGRGKTWLMDRFYESLAVPAKRQHFHHFMRWVHQRLFQLTGQENPLTVLAHELASEVKVLCFDELFVSDIGDAILISGLVQELFAQGLVMVATSNQHPDQLYEDGFNRERLLPAIAALKQHMQVLSVDGGEDHRLHPGEVLQKYWVNNADAFAQQFYEAVEKQQEHLLQGPELTLGPVAITVQQRSEHILWCEYSDLCEQPLAAVDFIALCDQFSAIFLDQLPQLTCDSKSTHIARGTEDGVMQVKAGDRTLPQLSRKDDGVRRFIALVDECYDRGVPLYINAAVPLDELYTQGALLFPFQRTYSRLQEMQLARFGR